MRLNKEHCRREIVAAAAFISKLDKIMYKSINNSADALALITKSPETTKTITAASYVVQNNLSRLYFYLRIQLDQLIS
jgi:hypothetical protein